MTKLELNEDSFKINGFINEKNEMGIVLTLSLDEVYALWCALNNHNLRCIEKLSDKNVTLSQYDLESTAYQNQFCKVLKSQLYNFKSKLEHVRYTHNGNSLKEGDPF